MEIGKKSFLFFFIVVAYSQLYASHLVGGEFELLHKQDFTYSLNLILYFDVLNGNPGARDSEVTVTIFRKSDNAIMGNFVLPLLSNSRVNYFQPDCSNGEVVTDKLLYSFDIYLSPDLYNDPDGYYVSWQRCCRNYTITNIYSSAPEEGQHAGQTYYLEFPPVVDEFNNPFVNSSPELFPPLNDYACPNRPYWVDFAGKDRDGDSLVYSLSTPLSTQFNSALPPSGQNLPRPYPGVVWKSGFGIQNIMNGAPDLTVTPDGFISLIPKSQGLFVFAVKVEEYRNKVKIGELRRDFQLLVVDKCPVADPPVVRGKKISDAGYPYVNTMDVTFNKSILQEERCIRIQVSDADASKLVDNNMEKVWIKAIPLNFKDDISEVLPNVVQATLYNGSTAEFDICFPECPYLESGPFEIGIVAFDDACTLPLSDTLRVRVNVEPPPNNSPYFENGGPIDLTVNEKKDGFWSTDIVGLDVDLDSLYLQVFAQGFDMAQYGMSFTTYKNVAGEIRTRFDWNYDCLQTSFDFKTFFQFILVLDDWDKCQFAHPDTLLMNLKIILPQNTFPDLYPTDIGDKWQQYFYLEKEIYETLEFNVFAEDLDNDLILLEAIGGNFNLETYGAQFPSKEGNGNPGIGSTFTWPFSCDKFNLAEQDSFRFYLVVEDFDYCNITSKDTLTFDVKVLPPANSKPVISIASMSESFVLEENGGTLIIGQQLPLLVSGLDTDPNTITLSLHSVEPEVEGTTYSFTEVSGYQHVESTLLWTPDCGALSDKFEEVNYAFTFLLRDNSCIESLSDTLVFNLLVKDKDPRDQDFLPPNVFTPNGDSFNQYFALEDISDDGNNVLTGLPIDNCAGVFEGVKIFNRWGNLVYQSAERNFKWTGEGAPAGVYYYRVEFSNKEFKGTVTMLY